ncbi:hypothetical protein JCM15519_21680 [Fundidesulfovibrio butyratiphilus]
MSLPLQSLGTALAKLDRKIVNRINTVVSVLVFGTGLVLLFKFHGGAGAGRNALLGLGKCFWLTIHQMAALAFLVGFGIHVLNNKRYILSIVGRWRSNLPEKIKKRSLEQVLLFAVGACVIFAGFYPWITMPGAPLRIRNYHAWIDIHNFLGLAFLIGSVVHVARRWRRLLK